MGHFGAEARWRPEAAALPPYAVQRKRANILARWPLDRVSIRRIRPGGDLRAALARPRREVADFNRGRHSAGLGAERTGTLLSQRRQDDGCRGRDRAGVRRGQTQAAVRRALRDRPLPFFAKLRCQPRRSALPDDQGERARSGGDANQRCVELVGRPETPRTHREITMVLKSGTHLGPYEIVAPLGAGGMGEVYRARDSRLGREVAIKVLPESFSKDPDRLRRFEQEARAASKLNHPNIVTVHDFGTYEDAPYAVQELLEGETLRERLRTGALPASKAVEYGIQVARGLAAAHEKGIVHRDLKPENLFLTSDDRLKILDFGLAKLAAAEGPAAEQDGLPTATQATTPGIVMGTLGYMAPEQARGQTVDQRADIFALGAILYEMLSGASAFKRGSSADTMSAILKEDPPELPSDSKVPPALERIVRRCLEKQPNQRFQDTSDVAFALEALSGTATHLVDAAAQARSLWRQRLVPALALIAAVAIGALAGHRLFRSEAPQPKFTAVTFRRGTVFNARFSPDGNSIYYAAAWDGNPVDVYVASRDDPGARSLGVSGDPLLAVSRKGDLAILTHAQYLYQFSYVGTLALLPPSGGSPRELLENVREADFAPDGETPAVVRAERGKNILEYPAGHILYETPGWISYMRISPDGNRVAFLDHSVIVDDRGDVAVVDRNGKTTVLSHDWEGEGGLAWSPDGKEVWFTATESGWGFGLHAVTLDGKERLVLAIPGQMMVLDMARDGRALISRGSRHVGISALLEGEKRERDLSWLDGSEVVHISDDGKLIAFEDWSEPNGLYYAACIRKTDGTPVVRLGEWAVLALSPDARWVFTVTWM